MKLALDTGSRCEARIGSGGSAAGPAAMGVAGGDGGRAGPGRARPRRRGGLAGAAAAGAGWLLVTLGRSGGGDDLAAGVAGRDAGRLRPGRAGAPVALPAAGVGRAGRRRVTLLVTPVVVRRLLDLLVGGTLLAQATLAATSGMPSGHRRPFRPWRSPPPRSPVVPPFPPPGTTWVDPAGPARPRQAVTDPAGTRPTPRRSAAPLPPWLGGGPSKPAPVHRGRATARGRAHPTARVAGWTTWVGRSGRATPSRWVTRCGTSRPPPGARRAHGAERAPLLAAGVPGQPSSGRRRSRPDPSRDAPGRAAVPA